jgi:hypothetical protein
MILMMFTKMLTTCFSLQIPQPTAAQQAVWNRGNPSQTASAVPPVPFAYGPSGSAISQAHNSVSRLETTGGKIIYNPVSKSPIQLMYKLHPDANFIVNCYGSR